MCDLGPHAVPKSGNSRLPTDSRCSGKFVPLRLTVRGKAGTGKSALVKFIVRAVRRKYNAYDCIQVVAPTGSAANGVGGKTIHNRFGIPIHSKNLKISPDNLTKQLKKNSRLLVLILDERSMVSSSCFHTLHHYVSTTIFNGALQKHEWGAIPVLILVGDDGQLPPPIYPGIFSAFKNRKNNEIVHKGNVLYKNAASRVATLDIIK